MILLNIILSFVLLTHHCCHVFENQSFSGYPFTFVQLTDPQFGMFSNNEGFDKETGLYTRALMKIKEIKPDFVIITGDFVHDPTSELQIQEFKRITDQIRSITPVYLVPGNHDIGTVNDQNLKRYIERFGNDKFSFEHKGSRFIGFNSSLVKAKTSDRAQDQYDWLENQLALGSEADQTLLFCHYPFFIEDISEPESYSNIPAFDREKYFSIFNMYGVDAIFSGHLHKNVFTKYKDIQIIITSAVGKPLGDNTSGMRVVKVYNDRIEYVYLGLE